MAVAGRTRTVPDFRALVALREQRGELLRITREVDPRHEMPALMALCEAERRAVLFERVRGSRFPVLGGLLNHLPALGWACGSVPGEPFGEDELVARLDHALAHRIAPVQVTTGPVKEVVQRGADIDLGALPVPTVFELDSGPFITGACGIARHPQTGELNVGVYRVLVLDRDRIAVNAVPGSDLDAIYRHHEAAGTPMDIALAIGMEPALMMAAVCRLPVGESELGVAGGLLGRAIGLVRCETSALSVPASAEFVIEGRVDFSQRVENTLGEFAGQYGSESAPVTVVQAITHRRDAMLHAVLAGRHAEHVTLGTMATAGLRRMLAQALTAALPPLAGLHVYLEPALGSMAHVVLAIDKHDDEQPMRLAEAAFAVPVATPGGTAPASYLVKRVVIVDPDIDVHDLADVEWALWTRTARAAKFSVRAGVESWALERCARRGTGSLRIAVDATMDIADRERLRRTVIPGAAAVRLADYLHPETP